MIVPPPPPVLRSGSLRSPPLRTGGRGEETKTTTNILTKVPNSFQDLTKTHAAPTVSGGLKHWMGLFVVLFLAAGSPAGAWQRGLPPSEGIINFGKVNDSLRSEERRVGK